MFGRSAALAAIVLAAAVAPAAQELRVLHIKVTVADSDGRARPVPRHALLISDNPTTAAPRRVVTSLEGTVDVRLKPGNYTVESDEPLIYQGRAYRWMRTLDVPAGGDSSLEFTTANAEVETSSQSATMKPGQSSPSELLMQWQGNAVGLWGSTSRGAGFVLDRRGLILTNQRVVAASEIVEVQLTATTKFPARVLASDPVKNVAVIWMDPSLAASVTPAKLGYKGAAAMDPFDGDDVFVVDVSAIDRKTLASGRLVRVDPGVMTSDIRIDYSGSGSPLLSAAGEIIGIITIDERTRRQSAVRIDEARGIIAEAERKMAGAAAPSPRPLPVEPLPPASEDVLKAVSPKRVGSISPYRMSTSDFDLTFITPPINYASRHPPERTTGARKAGGPQDLSDLRPELRALEDFGNWSDYVREVPSALIIRATPKLKENFWTMIGRNAARTQGVELPAFKKMRDSFARMQLYCGANEVPPIHPFRIEHRVDADNAMFEGLYVFDPAVLTGDCGRVRLVLFSEKATAKGNELFLDAKLLDRLANDLASIR